MQLISNILKKQKKQKTKTEPSKINSGNFAFKILTSTHTMQTNGNLRREQNVHLLWEVLQDTSEQ